jgi:hypothetical protein
MEEARTHAILTSVAGFPILLVLAFAWLAAGGVSYVLPTSIAGWVYPAAGAPAIAGAIILERRLGYVPAARPDPFLTLTLQVLFIQVVAFPAVALVWDSSPEYVPVAFAAVVGAHFLLFEWMYRTRLYRVLALLVAIGQYVLAILFRERALHYTGFHVGPVLLVGALSHDPTVQQPGVHTGLRSRMRPQPGVPAQTCEPGWLDDTQPSIF